LGEPRPPSSPDGQLVPNAHLAALAIEHGVEIIASDTDVARFIEVHRQDPLAD